MEFSPPGILSEGSIDYLTNAKWTLGSICCLNSSHTDVVSHVMSHKDQVDTFLCFGCKKKILDIKMFLLHLKANHIHAKQGKAHDYDFCCPEVRCRQFFSTSHSLNVHLDYHKQRTSWCKSCGREVAWIGQHALEIHKILMV